MPASSEPPRVPHADPDRTETNPPEKYGCFVAYPSSPVDRAESIERAIETIQSGGVVDIIGWKSLRVSGRVIITTICDEIKKRDVFIADVTGLNPNVLFELGYAIAHRKRIWLLVNPRIERAKQAFEKFQWLTTIGFTPFDNSSEIVSNFYKDEPYNDLNQNLYDELSAAGPVSKKDALLYLRPDINTEASLSLARRVASGPIKSVIDDPQEMQQPFAWYVQQVRAAFAVVTHFLSNGYEDWETHNAKHALVSGLAHGSAKPLLMLAHDPYASPLDYRDLLRKHRTAKDAESIFAAWSLPHIEQYEKRIAKTELYKIERKAQRELRDITIGEPVAELESETVADYYVTTAMYGETRQSKYSIVVGRKGTGKTATLYTLLEDLSSDPRNHICVIKPVGYELEGLLGILHHELSRAEQGYLVESFWKFLIYTELTKSIYDELLSKPNYYVRTTAESTLCEFIEQQQTLIAPEFSIRLEATVSRLHGLSEIPTAEKRRTKISELLHHEMLSKLRVLLGNVLEAKARVTMMVDNLDKAWDAHANLQALSDLLFGLLSASRRVAEDFTHDSSNRSPVNLYFILFLRSDIYAAMLPFAKERDKLPVRQILWDDPELLRRVIEERFMKSVGDIKFPAEVWERYFATSVNGVSTWEYICNHILPRPRDLIVFIKAAQQLAVNRGRTKVEEKDFVDGERRYSSFALNSLITEGSARIVEIEDLLVQFVQSPEVISEFEVWERLTEARIPDGQFNMVVDLLCELTFLGFEVSPNRFEFLYDEQNRCRNHKRLQALSDTSGIPLFP